MQIYGTIFLKKLRGHEGQIRRIMSSCRDIKKLQKRGILENVFPPQKGRDLQNYFNGDKPCVYAGFDPTANSLHIGNLLVVQSLLHLQRAGIEAIALVGGATARIGDPSGKSTQRSSLDLEVIDINTQSLVSSLNRIFNNHELYHCQGMPVNPIKIVNNANWYSNINIIDFLSKTGRYFRMGTLLGRHSIESRLKSDQGMNFTEFSYQILQSYDWLHLHDKYNCHVQIGGNDQSGNIMSGHELINKTCSSANIYGLTVPLLTTSSGEKLGKTAGNAIWLDGNKTSAFHFYQYFLNIEDSEVFRFLYLFTFLSESEIENLMIEHWCKPYKKLPHHVLAEQVTLLIHGESGLKSAKLCTKALFHKSTEALSSLNKQEQEIIFKESTLIEISMEPAMTILDLIMKTKHFTRLVDADRVIKAGGIHLNHIQHANPDEIIQNNIHVLSNGITIIRIGKRNTYLIKWVQNIH